MIYWVMPPLMTILTEAGTELPWTTKFIMAFTGFFRSWGWTILLAFAAFLIFFFAVYKNSDRKTIFDANVLKVPAIGPLLRKIYLSRFAENISTLISGGLPIAQLWK
jgi:type IV pilus assembly protein PilC